MSFIWNSNIALFCERFPSLAQKFGVTPKTPEPALLSQWERFSAKNGSPVAKENGKFLHSQYNPEREAEQTAKAAKKDGISGCAFFSCGLGYAPIAYATLFPKDTLIIIEPCAEYFFAALALLDWSPVFTAERCIIALNATPDEAANLIETNGGFAHCAIIANNNHMQHAQDYFSALAQTIERAKQKSKINANTQERFAKLWIRNSCRNLPCLGSLEGVVRYQNVCPPDLSAVVLAAGPTLDAVLPHLAEIKKRSLLICTDTALRTCLRAGVEPDFIVLVDPQYYAARHIAGLSSPSSVLITESAAYPPVLRFPCRDIVLCSSLFPLGMYFERRLGKKGALSAGGSVSTTAWDFARFVGAKTIFMAGLDLGYPDFQTHIRGSTFEEKIHTISKRTQPAETAGIASLFGANMTYAKDYDGKPILTDDRMQLFGWWFESKIPEYPEVRTCSFSPKSLAIPGISVANVQDFLQTPEKSAERAQFFSAESAESAESAVSDSADRQKAFQAVYDAFMQGLDDLYRTLKKGIALADQGIAAKNGKTAHIISQLNQLDAKILCSEYKDVASLVFPLEHKLNALFSATNFSSDPVRANFERTKIIYRELQKGVAEYQKYLFPRTQA